MFDKIINNRIIINNEKKIIYEPVIYRTINASERRELEQLLDKNSCIQVSDTIMAQLKELIKTKNPTTDLTDAEIEQKVNTHLNGISLHDYGVWVYYPWSERLVHLLDEAEFVEMRTNRNRHKITTEEQAILSKKRVGVVGLSVGQSVAVTMSIERTFGELRIADFDDLEITNMNRLRSGVHNMGLKKTVMVCREIAEIDPFIKVTPFHDGLTTDNMDAFFSKGGNLDLVIDECDGLDMKILLRHKAKSLRIPVLMEASDRGTFDVERFDLEPNRSLLHGFIDHLDHTKIASLTTNEQKIPYILPMLGLETISKRLRASMVEIKQTINTWPQLASAVALGGAICADVYRRVMLDQYHGSGRFFVDIEDFVGDQPRQMEGDYKVIPMTWPELKEADMEQLAESMPAQTSEIDPASLQKLAEAGISAPSAGNNQPWKWLSKNGSLYLFHDKKQSYSWTDEEDFIARIALGAALENVLVCAASMDYVAQYDLFPLGDTSPLVAAIRFQKAKTDQNDAALAPYIGMRCTNRKNGNNDAIDSSIIDELKKSVDKVKGAGALFLTTPEDIKLLADIESSAERIRFLHPQSHHEFFTKELRWNNSGREVITEGLDIKTLEMSINNETGLKVASDPGVIALLNKWHFGKAFEKPAREAILTSSAIGLITMPSYSAENYIGGGRAAERVWLKATGASVAIHPISAPLFLYAKLRYGSQKGIDERMINEINELYRKLCILLPELNERLGVFLFRLSKAEAPTARSLRKPIEELYSVR